MRPQNTLDWIAFVFLLIGAFAWGYSLLTADINILDVMLERITDPLDDVVYALIALSGIYWIVRVFQAPKM